MEKNEPSAVGYGHDEGICPREICPATGKTEGSVSHLTKWCLEQELAKRPLRRPHCFLIISGERGSGPSAGKIFGHLNHEISSVDNRRVIVPTTVTVRFAVTDKPVESVTSQLNDCFVRDGRCSMKGNVSVPEIMGRAQGRVIDGQP